MTPFVPRKSSPRLPDFDYRGRHDYFATINTTDRQRELVGDFAETCAGTLLESAAQASFEVMAYCLMPGHVLRGEEDVDDIAAYFWHNPVRAGLVASAAEYAYSGPPEGLGALSDRPEGLSLCVEGGLSLRESLGDRERA